MKLTKYNKKKAWFVHFWSHLLRKLNASQEVVWPLVVDRASIHRGYGQRRVLLCPKAHPPISIQCFFRNYADQGPPIFAWWLRSFWWSAGARILHWSQNCNGHFKSRWLKGNDIETGRIKEEESPYFYRFWLLNCPCWLRENQNKHFFVQTEWLNMQVFIYI